MNRFLQLHLLTNYGPANLNRDDSGRPKTVMMGGALRLRVSSQSLKRAWRTSEVFEAALGTHTGTRTKRMGIEVYQALVAAGIADKDAKAWAAAVAGRFGKLKKAGKSEQPLVELEIEQLAHFSPEERATVMALATTLAQRRSGPQEAELKLLRKDHKAVDIALFGRMLADEPSFNTEAAAQVAHAIAVHKCAVEDDFYTAVDDLNTHEEDAGAGHMGATEYGAAVYYLYLCIDRRQLLDTLGGDRALADRAVQTLLECAATVAPGGKQNSFASRARASYILAEKGDGQPRQLSAAFLKPVWGADLLEKSIEELSKTVERFDQVYDDCPCAALRMDMNALTGEGSLSALRAFVAED